VVAAALFLLTGLVPARAASAPGDDVEVEGPIEALGAASVTVAGRTFAVDTRTEIRGDHGAVLAFSDLAVGMLAEVEGHGASPDSLVADRVRIEDDRGGDGRVRAEGQVTARTDSSLTAGGLTFGVTASTRIVGAATFDDVALGMRVEVRGRLLAGGRLVAERIKVRRGHGGGDHGAEVHGLIESVSADSLVVSGRTFALTPETVVVGHHQTPLPTSALEVGQRVEVRGRFLADGTLVATRIEIESFDEGELEVSGLIEALTDSSLTVAGNGFAVTAQTVVLDDDRRPIAFGTLAVGQTVEVRGVNDGAGVRVATRIQLEDAGSGGEVEARASIDSVGDSVVVVLGRPFVVRPTTRIVGLNDRPVALADLAAGQSVEVHARLAADGTLTALRIEREDGPASAVRLRATVTDVSADSVAVVGVLFDASGAVVVRHDGTPATLGDLAVGQAVEVTGVRTPTGGLTATRIEIRRGAHAAGRIATTGAGAFTLPGLDVAYTAATLFVAEDGATVAPSSVTAGASVLAAGTTSGAGTLDATLVVVLASSTVVSTTEGTGASPFGIERVYPNPAVQTATVRYTLGAAARVEVTLVDALGRTVLRLASADAAAGTHEARLDVRGLPAGLYLARLNVDGRPAGTRPVTVVR
jgi:hypothetical protein